MILEGEIKMKKTVINIIVFSMLALTLTGCDSQADNLDRANDKSKSNKFQEQQSDSRFVDTGDTIDLHDTHSARIMYDSKTNIVYMVHDEPCVMYNSLGQPMRIDDYLKTR